MPTAPDESSADLAYRKLRQMLSDGELVPGQRLSQSRLGRQLGCSPMPVVEAMRRLESDGLLLIERTAGRSFHSEEKQEAHPHCHRALVQAIVDHDADSAEYLMNIFRARMLRSSASSLPKRHSPAGSGEQRRHDAIVDAAEHGDARNLIADGLLAN